MSTSLEAMSRFFAVLSMTVWQWSMPSFPVQALALPLFTTMARIGCPLASTASSRSTLGARTWFCEHTGRYGGQVGVNQRKVLDPTILDPASDAPALNPGMFTDFEFLIRVVILLRKSWSRFKASCFWNMEHQVTVLNRLAGRTLHQIIDRSGDNEPVGPFINGKTNIAKVGASHTLSGGIFTWREDANERFALVKFLKVFAHLIDTYFSISRNVQSR